MTDRDPKRPRMAAGDTIFEETPGGGFRTVITTPTLTVEFGSGRGITAIYDHGMTESEAREFAERLVAHLDQHQPRN